MKKSFLFLACVALAGLVFAQDSSDQTYGETSQPAFKTRTDLSTDQRLAVLERQIYNLNQQNLASQIQDLQSQIADLKGRLETVEHSLQQMNDQIKQQYQDVDQRLQNVEKNNTAQVQATASEESKTAAAAKTLEANEQALESPSGNKKCTADVNAEQQAYQKAFLLLKKKDYVRAIPAFQNFLAKYSCGPYVANGYFWLAELHLLQGQPDSAVNEYKKVINDFAGSDKVPMAAVKLGFAYAEQGNKAKARTQFQQVMKKYPNTKVANLAKTQLDQLGATSKTGSQ